ncbi:MAG: sigma-70 family RNA polymerase sigma factor [bacterium]|nr:sigma-70 family RNA polymerase sigma factor [bacterium]MCP4965985.1 sigma-70 family RNA polymerase sigma factor [bacterium]
MIETRFSRPGDGPRAGVEFERMDLGDLYKRTVDGDAAAFDELYVSLKDLVWWAIRNGGVTGADAEDVFQTTWAKFFEYLGRHRNPNAIKGWLVAVARNLCMDLGRVSGRTQPIELLMEMEADDHPPDELAIRSLDIDVLEEVLFELSERERQLVALWAHGASYKEMHLAIGIPAGSVGPTMARCREKLAAKMKERS